MDNYLDQIETFLKDEKQIVTYKWLSKKLEIHSNVAKRVLAEYIENAARKSQCLVTYLITGRNESGLSVVVAPEEIVSKVKSQFDNILGEHVYSLQGQKSSIDLNNLYNVDKTFHKPLPTTNLTSIRYPKDVILIKKECHLKKSTESDVTPESVSSGATASAAKKTQNISNGIKGSLTADVKKNGKKIEEMRSSSSKHSLSETSKKLSIFSMWDKQKTKKQAENVTSEDNHNSVTKDADESNSYCKDTDKKLFVDKNASGTDVPVSLSNGLDNDRVLKRKDNEKTKTAKKSKHSEKVPSKKMKRIVVFSDSDSNDENKSDLEEALEPEPEPVPEPDLKLPIAENNNDRFDSTSTTLNKRKRRKVVDKTEIGEDGFFYTKKEVVYESCNEDDLDEKDKMEEKIENKRLEADLSANKNVHKKVQQEVKQKTKQSSIMAFLGKPKNK